MSNPTYKSRMNTKIYTVTGVYVGLNSAPLSAVMAEKAQL